MMRSILAVLAGYAVMAVLVVISTAAAARVLLGAKGMKHAMKLRPTPAYLAVNLACSCASAALGGFTAAYVAARAPMGHAAALGALMLLMAVLSRLQNANSNQPVAYGWALVVLLPAFAILGGSLRAFL
jgi:hypothetical protein